MGDVLKILGQLDAAGTTSEALYTVPNLVQATTSTLVVCNRTGGALTYRISAGVAGEALADKQYIRYNKTIAASDSEDITIGMTLGQGDVVRVYTSAADITFTLFGVETS